MLAKRMLCRVQLKGLKSRQGQSLFEQCPNLAPRKYTVRELAFVIRTVI